MLPEKSDNCHCVVQQLSRLVVRAQFEPRRALAISSGGYCMRSVAEVALPDKFSELAGTCPAMMDTLNVQL